MRLLPLILALAACCGACGKQQDPACVQADCQKLYVALPANFIIDLAANAHVTLNPAAGHFAVFCSLADARQGLADANLAGDWRIYSLKGSFEELAEPAGDGQYRLAVPAELDDWID